MASLNPRGGRSTNMWHTLLLFILQILRDPALQEIGILLAILTYLLAALRWVRKLLPDLKNSLCFYNETTVLKVKQAI